MLSIHIKLLGREKIMSNFLAFLSVISVAFWVTLIIFIINKIRKKSSKLTWKVPAILFVSGLLLVVGSSMTESNSSNESASSSEKSSKSSSSDDDDYSDDSSDSDDYSDDSSDLEEDSDSELSSEETSSSKEDTNPQHYQTGITYDQVARTPDDYKDQKIQFTGRVVQVMEDDDDTQIRLAVDGNYDNIILIDIDNTDLNGSRILEDDLVTASGISAGTTSYDSTMAGTITIPSMTTVIINNQGKASDDYGE